MAYTCELLVIELKKQLNKSEKSEKNTAEKVSVTIVWRISTGARLYIFLLI